jgi:hypothetical protein
VILQAINTVNEEINHELVQAKTRPRHVAWCREAGFRPHRPDNSDLTSSLSGVTKNKKAARFRKIREELERTRAPGDIARLLNQHLDFTQADLAVATGAHWRTVAGWLGKEAQSPGNNLHRQRLHQLKAIVDLSLEDGTIAEDLVDWFRDPNRNLGYRTPFELIAEGRWQQAGISLCETTGIPKAVWPEAFRIEAAQAHKKPRSSRSIPK